MDKISQERRRKNMQAIKSKNTKPEMVVRRLIHEMGFRYRLHGKNLPGKPDLVFSTRKKVIFIHGCFWHAHSNPECKISRVPKSNEEFWIPKLEATSIRDRKHITELQSLGWKSLVIWECEIKNKDILIKNITKFLHDLS